MRKRFRLVSVAVLTCAIAIIAGGAPAFGQTSGIREVENKKFLKSRAPAECIEAFRAFFKYAQKAEPDIVADTKAQERWLSKRMRESLSEFAKRSGSPSENPDYPSNQTFLGVWNKPTTFSIVSTRHYDYRDKDNPDDDRAVIDVLYEWEKNPPPGSLENQYPGEKQLFSFIFVREDGTWKLHDIYNFASHESLRGYFEHGTGLD
jgi:hypothetical protein